MSPNLDHLLLLSFTLVQVLRHTATADANLYPVYTYCPYTTFPGPIPYAFQSNLQTLLSALSSAANRTTTGFSSATSGTDSYPLFGIFQCRGDVPSTICTSCINTAVSDLYRSCSRSNQAMIWYNLCMMKYSNTSFLGNQDNSTLGHAAFRRIQTVDGNMTAFDSVLGAVASKVKEDAATGGGLKKFATVAGRVNASLTVYVLGQCTPYLSAMDCRNCLGECIRILPTCCENKQGGLVLFGSCNLRYDTLPFYNYSGGGGSNGSGDFSSYSLENLLTPAALPQKKVQLEVLQIECGVLVTTILLLGLFVLGCLRRRVYGSWPGFCILGSHSLIIILIPLLLGLMRNASLPQKLYPIWAGFLLFAYGGFDTMTARDLGVNDNSTSYLITYISLCFWVGFVAGTTNIYHLNTSNDTITLVAYEILFFLSIWNIVETWGAFNAASKSDGLPEASKKTEDYMRRGFINNNYNTNTNDEETTVGDAVFMSGYPYLVDGTQGSNIVTTTQVWQCVDKLLKTPKDDGNIRGHTHPISINPNMTNNESGGRLKDICLSRALFNILLMRCAGYCLQESARNKSRRFVEEGFLSMGDPRKMHERVFTIIEWELDFLFDFFYTKFYYLSTKRFAYKIKRLVCIPICLWFAIYGLEDSASIILLHKHRVDVGVTRMVIILIAIGEAVQLCMRIFSNWTIVKLICLYASEFGIKKTVVIKTTILFISIVRDYLSSKGPLSSCMFKLWKRKLGQYSLLESYDKVPMLHRLLRCLWYGPRVSQKESPAVTLSSQVKGAIISSLSDYGFALSCGKASLARNGLAGQLSSFCSTEPEGDAYVILVWHIATSVCEHQFLHRPSDEHFRVATQLSKYCAYLVVFAPELLSGVPFESHTTVLDAINCAHKKFKGTIDIIGRCSMLVSAEHQLSDMDEQDETLFGRATVLGYKLRSLFLDNPNRGWRVLAEFWVELILYLAPTENATAHAEKLSKGGEFITLLWALLTNAGITSRSHFPTTL